MSVRSISTPGRILLALSVLLLGAGQALAYVGPGAGLEFVGYFMSLLVWIGFAFSAVLLWPFYALLRRFRRNKDSAKGQLLPASNPEESAEKQSST